MADAILLGGYLALLPVILLRAARTRAPVHRDKAAALGRVCTSLAAYLVAFGLSQRLADAGVTASVAYQLLLATAILDLRLLWSYFWPSPRELAT